MCRFPNVNVQLPDTDGISETAGDHLITQRVIDALRVAGADRFQVGEYLQAALAGDHTHTYSALRKSGSTFTNNKKE